MDLFHPLKLYGDEKTTEAGLPVVLESYDELVLSEPTWVVWEKLQKHQKKPAPETAVLPYVRHHAEHAELQAVLEARQKVAMLAHGARQGLGGAGPGV